jgi:hypothetical protein
MATIESATEIRSFHVDVPEEEELADRRRIAATRWPEEAWEEPELFSEEIRAAFTSLRDRRRSS